MQDNKPKAAVTILLERLVEAAPEGTAEALFAHRHLAEYRIEDNPWRALIHLRRIDLAGKADDAVHALAGLAHAILGNYLSAVAAYRRAVRMEPKNPWYRHNLGHLLDVAVDRPSEALRHLEVAASGADGDAEIAASLAHCLARIGQRDRAEAIAVKAAAAAPGSVDHEELLRWIRSGALDKPETNAAGTALRAPVAAAPLVLAAAPPPATGVDIASLRSAVDEVLRRVMGDGNFSAEEVERALELSARYHLAGAATLRRRVNPNVIAAALEYAVGSPERPHVVSFAAVARRYGVKPRAVADRIAAIERSLELRTF